MSRLARLRLPTGAELQCIDGKLNFDQSFSSQVRTNVLWLYSLVWLGQLLDRHAEFGDRACLEEAVLAARQYLAYVSTPEGRQRVSRNRGLGAVNHSYAVRTKVLLRLIRVLRSREHSAVAPGLLLPLAREVWACAEWLWRDQNRTPDNHGVMVDLALYEVGAALGLPNAYTTKAITRLSRAAEALFEPSGYCRENSAAYHRFNLQLHEKAYRLFAGTMPQQAVDLQRLGHVCAKARAILPALVRDDGSLPPVGDGVYTSFVAEPAAHSTFRSPHFGVARRAGGYLSFTCGQSLPFHKHVDDLSLTWQHQGRDILIDGGSFNYDREDPTRRCLESSLGHSGLSVAPMAHWSGRHWSKVCAGCAIERFDPDDSGLTAKASVSIPDWQCRLSRDVRWNGLCLVVNDRAEYAAEAPTPARSMCQQWLLGPGLRLLSKEQGPDHVRILLRNDAFGVELLLAASGDEVVVHHGHVSDDGSERRGWYSPARDQVAPTLAIGVRRNSNRPHAQLTATFTVIALADLHLPQESAVTASTVAPTRPSMQVTLTGDERGLEASAERCGPADALYAFYLLRNGERVASRPYAPAPRAAFSDRWGPGTYAAKAFCRGADGRIASCLSSPVVIDAAATPPPPARLARHDRYPAPEPASSLQELSSRIDPDRVQRLDVNDGALTYCILKGKARGKRLFVVLVGAIDRDRVEIPRFSRFSWRDEFSGTFMCIADPTLALASDLRLGWYFGTRGQDAVEGICRIVEVLCHSLGVAVEDVYFYGSSGGGFAALRAAALLGRGATAIAINPQVDVLDYPSTRFVDAFLTRVLGGVSKTRARGQYGARLSALDSWQLPTAAEARCLLVQNLADADHYRGHFRVFADAHGVPDNGNSPDGRMASIVYEHPSGHAAEPREMLPTILASAGKLARPLPEQLIRHAHAGPGPEENDIMKLLERIAAAKPRQDFLNHTYISLRHGYMYAAVGKAANSTVKHHLYELEYSGTRFKTKSLHDRQSSPLLSPYQLPNEMLAEVLQSQRFVRFTVVRNPYSRILSCYLDRIVPANSQPYRQLITVLGRQAGESVSFDEFVRAICAQRPFDQNNHWRLQVAEVCFNEIRYDEVGKQETFAQDMARIWRRIAHGKPIPDFAAENKAPSITSAERRLAEFYTADLIDLIRTAYAADFDTFGYSRDPVQA